MTDAARLPRRLRSGLDHLIGGYPFHAALIDGWRIRHDPTVPTMGVRLGHDLRVELHVNPAFVARLTPDELAAVLVHEVHHVIFGHLVMPPEQYPNHRARVIAQEVTANEFVAGPLPGPAIRLEIVRAELQGLAAVAGGPRRRVRRLCETGVSLFRRHRRCGRGRRHLFLRSVVGRLPRAAARRRRSSTSPTATAQYRIDRRSSTRCGACSGSGRTSRCRGATWSEWAILSPARVKPMSTRHVSLRMDSDVFERLERRHRQLGRRRPELINRCIDEALRMEDHVAVRMLQCST